MLSFPISLELFKNALSMITDEMSIAVVRTSHSNAVREMLDFSCAICDDRGRVIAQGLGLALHLGTMPDVVRGIHANGPYEEGDVIAVNDPYNGGTHLPDIYLVRPIFNAGEMLGYSVVNMHHVDIGGRVAGSVAPDSTEIFQEGLRFGPEFLYRRGVPNETLLRIIAANSRLPEKIIGDLKAQAAACLIGERGMLRLVERHGVEYVRRHMNAVLDYAEHMARAEITRLRDGTYDFVDYLDDDSITNQPVKLMVAVTVAGDRISVDFEGSSPQVRGAVNSALTMTRSAVYCTIRSIMRSEIPDNEGFCRSIEVKAPARSVVNPSFPAAVGARGVTAHRLCDVMLGALAKIAPDRVMAADEGGSTNVSIGGIDADDRPFVLVEFVYGAWGGRPGKDGIDGIANIFANLSNNPVEVLEAEFPIRIEDYGFVPDTGGPGKYRGGLSVRRNYRLLCSSASLTVRSDRRLFPPHGVDGGKHGAPSANLLLRGDEDRMLPTKFTTSLICGDIFETQLAGGGGHGEPLERSPDAVLEDVRDGKVTPEHARAAYGVVLALEGDAVDHAATDALRLSMGNDLSNAGGMSPGEAAYTATA